MKEKIYIHREVVYGYSPIFRKWRFVVGKTDYLTAIRGGAETAHKVARIIQGAVARCGGLDNMARANISRINPV
jgi:hypothetical protein